MTMQITEHLEVKGDPPGAYVDGNLVSYCSYVLVTAPIDTPEDNMNDIIKIYGKPERECRDIMKNVSNDTLILAHASNIQAWVEHDYDPRILHTNIAFPLLRALATVDPAAMDKSLEIVHERWKQGSENSRKAIIHQFPQQISLLGKNGIIKWEPSPDPLALELWPDLDPWEYVELMNGPLYEIIDVYEINCVEFYIDFYQWFKNVEFLGMVEEMPSRTYKLDGMDAWITTYNENSVVVEYDGKYFHFAGNLELSPFVEISASCKYFTVYFDTNGYETYLDLNPEWDDLMESKVRNSLGYYTNIEALKFHEIDLNHYEEYIHEEDGEFYFVYDNIHERMEMNILIMNI